VVGLVWGEGLAVAADCRALSLRRWRVLPPWKVGRKREREREKGVLVIVK